MLFFVLFLFPFFDFNINKTLVNLKLKEAHVQQSNATVAAKKIKNKQKIFL